jgi:putative ABC transport system substrate-binding protein
MRRREFIASCATIVAVPSLARAQAGRVPKVGVLWHAGSPEEEGRYFTGMVQGFRDLGYQPSWSCLSILRSPGHSA